MCNERYYTVKDMNELKALKGLEVPTIFFTSDRYRGMVTGAKVLYSLIAHSLYNSMADGWFDEEGKAFTVYSRDTMAKDMSSTVKTIQGYVAALKKFDLLEERYVKYGVVAILYLKKPVIDGEDRPLHKKNRRSVNYNPLTSSPDEKPARAFLGDMNVNVNMAAPDGVAVEAAEGMPATVEEITTDESLLYNNNNIINNNNIYNIVDREVRVEESTVVTLQDGTELTGEEIVDLAEEVKQDALTKRKSFYFKSAYVPIEKLRAKLSSLTEEVYTTILNYVGKCSFENVKKLKAYLLAALYGWNKPAVKSSVKSSVKPATAPTSPVQHGSVEEYKIDTTALLKGNRNASSYSYANPSTYSFNPANALVPTVEEMEMEMVEEVVEAPVKPSQTEESMSFREFYKLRQEQPKTGEYKPVEVKVESYNLPEGTTTERKGKFAINNINQREYNYDALLALL